MINDPSKEYNVADLLREIAARDEEIARYLDAFFEIVHAIPGIDADLFIEHAHKRLEAANDHRTRALVMNHITEAACNLIAVSLERRARR